MPTACLHDRPDSPVYGTRLLAYLPRSHLTHGGWGPAGSTRPRTPHTHTWAELLTLVGAIRRIAYDITLQAGDAMRRIRDAFADYDGGT
jgi:hypothetical protein